MIVDIFYQAPVPKRYRKTGLFKKAVATALKKHGKKNIEISLVFVTKPEIHRMNQEFLGHDYVTDVISFPHPLPAVKTKDPYNFGDVFVCYEVAKEQAASYGHTILQEMLAYAIHGALHLNGMDDDTPAKRQKMDFKTEQIIEELLTA